jgi:hypothetical protein
MKSTTSFRSLLRLAWNGLPLLCLILVVIAGVNLQRRQRALERRVAELESHAGAQDMAILGLAKTVGVQFPGKSPPKRP